MELIARYFGSVLGMFIGTRLTHHIAVAASWKIIWLMVGIPAGVVAVLRVSGLFGTITGVTALLVLIPTMISFLFGLVALPVKLFQSKINSQIFCNFVFGGGSFLVIILSTLPNEYHMLSGELIRIGSIVGVVTLADLIFKDKLSWKSLLTYFRQLI